MAQLKDWQSGTSNDPYVVGSSGSLTLNQGTANGVAYLNGSKVVTSGSALVFDGTNFGVGTSSPAQKLHVNGLAYIGGTSAQAGFIAGTLSGVPFLQGYDPTGANNVLAFYTNESERMRLTSTGLGIGTSSPSGLSTAKLVVSQSADGDGFFIRGGGLRQIMLGTSSTMGYVNTDNTSGFGINVNGSEKARIDSSGRLLVGTTSSIGTASVGRLQVLGGETFVTTNSEAGGFVGVNSNADNSLAIVADLDNLRSGSHIAFYVDGFSEKARIDASGNLLVAKTTAASLATAGVQIFGGGDAGAVWMTRDNSDVLSINRLTSDGQLVGFSQATTQEGSISVSGTTVSYNGGHLSRWAQTTTSKDESIVKGTVLSNLDAMNIYTDAEGNPVQNEQLNKVKVSDAEGDVNVAGVFVNWTHDDAHDVDEINMAMTGDMIIRIAQGTTVQRGDLLMSAGNGTAKPQGDDIVRSKTIAKVTSTHVTCTYADGSYCVPCVLMAC
jgi:hypothetical protein